VTEKVRRGRRGNTTIRSIKKNRRRVISSGVATIVIKLCDMQLFMIHA